MLLGVLTTKHLIAAYDAGCSGSPVAATGFAELDSLTGGMVPGRVWILVGTPGQGRSTLVAQWAVAIAERSDRAVHVVTPRDASSVIASRLLSRIGRVPLPHLTHRRLDPGDLDRLDSARKRLAALELCLFTAGEPAYIPEVDPFHPQKTLTAVFVDDADLVSGITPEWLATCAAAGMFVLVSMPRHRVMAAPEHDANLDPAWARAADVILEIRHRGLSNGAMRPGEAELDLHYNRWGFLRTISALHQAHFSRFVDVFSS